MTPSPTPTPPCDVVVVGEYFCDLIFHQLAALPELGKEVMSNAFDTVPGGTFTPVLSLTRLGVDVLWQCGLGTDPYSAFIRAEAAAEGISDALFENVDRPLRRITTVFSQQDDRGFMTYVDGPDPSADVDKLLAVSPKIILFQGLSTLLVNQDLVERARALGITVICDCGHTDTTLADTALKAAVASVDIFMPSAMEATHLTGHTDLEKAVHALGDLVPSVIVKNGAEGVIGLIDGQVKRVPAKPVDVVDTTGAGDSFNAGFVYGLLKGKSFHDAMTLGALNGSISTTDLGGRAVPNEEQLIAEWTTFRS